MICVRDSREPTLSNQERYPCTKLSGVEIIGKFIANGQVVRVISEQVIFKMKKLCLSLSMTLKSSEPTFIVVTIKTASWCVSSHDK